MRLKSYFVHTMEEALQSAKVDLGEDAMLVDSKPLQAPGAGRARLEVIFAAPVTPAPPPRVEAPDAPAAKSLADLQPLRSELTTLLDALSRNPDGRRLEPFTPAWPQLEMIRTHMLRAEAPPHATDEMLRLCIPKLEKLALNGDLDADVAMSVAGCQLAGDWAPLPGASKATPRMVAFVGATGVGKTSAIAKIAFRHAIAHRQLVAVLSIDNLRIGASDQLAHICSLLGIRFEALDDGARLQTAVEAHRHCGLILIDTPGYGGVDADLADEAADNLKRVETLEVHLTLPATLRYREMHRRFQQFSNFTPSHLFFTRLDETEFFGPAWAFARDCRLPAEWMSTGPRIPEDLIDADPDRIATALLGCNSFTLTASRPTQNLASAATAGASRI